jgi:hypothetical protein
LIEVAAAFHLLRRFNVVDGDSQNHISARAEALLPN